MKELKNNTLRDSLLFEVFSLLTFVDNTFVSDEKDDLFITGLVSQLQNFLFTIKK